MSFEHLFRLGLWLQEVGYHFVTVTPSTHARVRARGPDRAAETIEDVFGWSRPFARSLLPESALTLLAAAGALEQHAGLMHSKVRYSTLGRTIFVHSAYPTTQSESVFFGPDTYRFTALIQRTLASNPRTAVRCIVDMGCGSGAGGIVAAHALSSWTPLVIMTDINPAALCCARANAALAKIPHADFRQGDLFSTTEESIDLIVANPPYLLDNDARAYRHGGGALGSGLSLRIVAEGLPHLAAGGMLILYTGAPMIDGSDTFLASVAPALRNADVKWNYVEIDPDVFGEELDNPVYARVERIAAVALVVVKSNPTAARASRPSPAYSSPP